ncbi:MAG: tetratricopeptide repeat protein [Promethearchaeota archaeon]|nr:MAG: tetratricopeptide repeat protein [Candidatus Lokiarchaeota archaeon]
MYRLNPEFDEHISEMFNNLFFGKIYDKIWNNPHKNLNEAIYEFIMDYYNKRSKITHRYSGSVIYFEIRNMIIGYIEYNDVDFKGLTEYTKNKLIACGIDYFLEQFHNTFREPEIDENEHIKIWYKQQIKWLLKIRSSRDYLIKTEKSLKKQISTDWKQFKAVWNKFKEQRITVEEFFLIGFMCFEKKKFLEILRSSLPFEGSKNLNLRYKEAMSKQEKIDAEFRSLDFILESWEDIVYHDPTDWTNLYKIGALYIRKADIEKNRDKYKKAVEFFNKIIVPGQTKMYLRNAFWGLAEAYEKLGDLEISEKYHQKSRQYNSEI